MPESENSPSASTVGRRSRSGCLECRKRRKKCDEGHPICAACLERGAECIYLRRGHTSTALMPIKPATESGSQILASLSQTDTSELIHHFDQTVANLISFKAGTTNPFFSNVLPLVPESRLVRSAVESVASAHLAVLGTGSQFDAQHLQLRTLSLLAHEISRNDLSDQAGEQSLAATLLLIYYEIVLGNSVQTARWHLQGAKAILESKPNLMQPEMSRFRFLLKAFQYFDVMVALSLHECPLLPCLPSSIDTAQIDETFGLIGSIWPIMHILATLLARRKYGEDVTSEALILEQNLLSWSINLPNSGYDAHEEAMMQIAHTYKYGGLLTLYTGLHVPSANQEHVIATQRAAIDSLLRVCILSGTMSTLTWPLFTVAMSSTSASDKVVLQHVFSKLLERQNMKVVEGARDKIIETWSTKSLDGVVEHEQQTPEVLLG